MLDEPLATCKIKVHGTIPPSSPSHLHRRFRIRTVAFASSPSPSHLHDNRTNLPTAALARRHAAHCCNRDDIRHTPSGSRRYSLRAVATGTWLSNHIASSPNLAASPLQPKHNSPCVIAIEAKLATLRRKQSKACHSLLQIARNLP